MFKFVALFAFVAVCGALALPDKPEHEVVAILKSEIEKKEDGSYELTVETADGTSRSESASLTNRGTEDEALEVHGSYKYINDLGEEVEVFYTAGKNGFVPHGSIINPEITAAAEAAKDLPADEKDRYLVKKSRDQ